MGSVFCNTYNLARFSNLTVNTDKNLISVLPRSMKNGIWQFLALDLANNNVCAKFNQYIAFSSIAV